MVCGFYRRAFLHEASLWAHVRALLILAFFAVLAVSAHFADGWFVFRFVAEFSQNLRIAYLVLSTLLYLMLQLRGIEDRELRQLVLGIVVQACGQAACVALNHVNMERVLAGDIVNLLAPSSFMATLWIWSRALASGPHHVDPHDVDPPSNCDSLLSLSRPHPQITRLLMACPDGNQGTGRTFLSRLQ